MKPEMFLQIEFVKWLDTKSVLFCASAAGARTSIRTAINLKRSGVRAGAPDIAIFEPRGAFCGLFIELKVNSYPTKEQKEWQNSLTKRGYKAYIMPSRLSLTEGLEWLKKAVNDYLQLGDLRTGGC